jgi:hypothetical protein
MSDELNTTEEPTIEVPVIEEPQGESKVDTDWKAEARKWENRAKASKADNDDAAKWREYEASLKPVQERLAEELTQAKAEASEASAKLLRYEVATQKGIPGEATALLKGSTLEELEAEAELLLSLIANQSRTKTLAPDVNQGQPANEKVGQLTAADLDNMSPSEINTARKAGRLNDVLGIH